MNISPVFALAQLIRAAFLRQQLAQPVVHKPRKARVEDADTGPEAAGKYRLRHAVHAGRSSSVRKLDRAARIEAGLRPLKFGTPTKRERRIALKQEARAA